jgi:hypothetical protein
MTKSDKNKSLADVLQSYFEQLSPIPGIYSIYLFDLKKKEKEYKILDERHNMKKSFKILKKIAPLFKDEEFEMLMGDFGERTIIQKRSDGIIFMLTCSKQVGFGKLMASTKSIKG